jgi:hypothetical protein
VVCFQRVPHQVIRAIDGEQGMLLLAKMTRSPISNAPVYFVAPNDTYEQRARAECTPMAGQWEEDGTFVLA